VELLLGHGEYPIIIITTGPKQQKNNIGRFLFTSGTKPHVAVA